MRTVDNDPATSLLGFADAVDAHDVSAQLPRVESCTIERIVASWLAAESAPIGRERASMGHERLERCIFRDGGVTARTQEREQDGT